jgi:mRNA interferase RelE/StbE
MLKKYDVPLRHRLWKAIYLLPQGDVVPVKGIDSIPPLYRLRVGKFRILFRMSSKEVFVDALDTRGDVYKSF